MKFCPECGTKVEGLKFCPECGYKVEDMESVKMSPEIDEPYTKRLQTETKQMVTSSTPKVPEPLSIESKPKRSPAKRGCLTVILIIIALGIVGSFLDSDEGSSADNAATDNPPAEKKLSENEQFAVDNEISEVLAESILTASSKIGIPTADIYAFEKTDNWASGERYKYGYEGTQFVAYINPDGTVNSLNSGTIKFYENNAVVCMAQDVVMTSQEKALVISYSKDAVLANLKSPSTAEFPGTVLEADAWSVSKNKTTYKVGSYVDAQNGFSAMIRSNFTVEFLWDGNMDIAPTVVTVEIE